MYRYMLYVDLSTAMILALLRVQEIRKTRFKYEINKANNLAGGQQKP